MQPVPFSTSNFSKVTLIDKEYLNDIVFDQLYAWDNSIKWTMGIQERSYSAVETEVYQKYWFQEICKDAMNNSIA